MYNVLTPEMKNILKLIMDLKYMEILQFQYTKKT